MPGGRPGIHAFERCPWPRRGWPDRNPAMMGWAWIFPGVTPTIAHPSLAAACARPHMYYIACDEANMHYSRGRLEGDIVAQRVTILVGTMTGTADLVAQDVADALAAEGIAAEVVAMDGLDAGIFTRNGAFLICSSTYGQGDVPDNAQ